MSQYFIKVKSCAETTPSTEPEYWSKQVFSPTQANLFYNLGNVGIGVPNPLGKLHVDGSVGIGSPFATVTPPENGLIVSGYVGIGTETPSYNLHVVGNVMINGPILGTQLTTTDFIRSNNITCAGTGGIGYATGAGGSVTQTGFRNTGVTLNKLTGLITLVNNTSTQDTTFSFVLTNSLITVNDHIIVTHVGGGFLGTYSCTASAAAGSATIFVRNVQPTATTSHAPVFKFTVLRSAVA